MLSMTPSTKPIVSPTSPTLSPSLSPTRCCTDNVFIHFGIYIAFFVGFVVICLFIDKCGVFNKYITRLADCFAEVTNDSHSKSCCCISSDAKRYSDEFYEVITDGTRIYYPLHEKNFQEKCLFPNGLNLFCFKLPIGLVENYIFYLFSNDDVLMMLFTLPGVAVSSDAKRMAFMCNQLFTFFWATAFLSSFQDPQDLLMVTYLIVIPFSLIFGSIIKFLVTCSCCNHAREAGNYFRNCAMACCLCPFSFILLWLAIVPAINTAQSGENPQKFIATYAYQVFALATLQRSFFTTLVFLPYGIFRIRFCYLQVGIGIWAIQKAETDKAGELALNKVIPI